jgi:hypothetical protein
VNGEESNFILIGECIEFFHLAVLLFFGPSGYRYLYHRRTFPEDHKARTRSCLPCLTSYLPSSISAKHHLHIQTTAIPPSPPHLSIRTKLPPFKKNKRTQHNGVEVDLPLSLFIHTRSWGMVGGVKKKETFTHHDAPAPAPLHNQLQQDTMAEDLSPEMKV